MSLFMVAGMRVSDLLRRPIPASVEGLPWPCLVDRAAGGDIDALTALFCSMRSQLMRLRGRAACMHGQPQALHQHRVSVLHPRPGTEPHQIPGETRTGRHHRVQAAAAASWADGLTRQRCSR